MNSIRSGAPRVAIGLLVLAVTLTTVGATLHQHGLSGFRSDTLSVTDGADSADSARCLACRLSTVRAVAQAVSAEAGPPPQASDAGPCTETSRATGTPLSPSSPRGPPTHQQDV